MAADDYTNAEIVRTLRAIREEVSASRQEAAANHTTVLGMLAAQRDEMTREYVKRETYEAQRETDRITGAAMATQVQSLVSLKDWVFRLVVGAVILALLGLVLVTNGGAPS